MTAEKFKQLQEINDRILVVSLALAYGIHLPDEEFEKLMDEWVDLKLQRMGLELGELSE